MTSIEELFRRLSATPFPQLGKRIGDFPLYDSILAGYARSLAVSAPLDQHAANIEADGETLTTVSALRAKRTRTKEEQEFLDYFGLLEEIRTRVIAAAGGRLPSG